MITIEHFKWDRHIGIFNEPLRPADAREITTVTGLPVNLAFRKCVADSKVWTKIACKFGQFLMAFGLSEHDGWGIPWMVASPRALKHTKELLRLSDSILQEMLDEFPVLFNFIDSRNTKHIRWLNHMGFHFAHEYTLPVDGIPFLYFYKEGNHENTTYYSFDARALPGGTV